MARDRATKLPLEYLASHASHLKKKQGITLHTKLHNTRWGRPLRGLACRGRPVTCRFQGLVLSYRTGILSSAALSFGLRYALWSFERSIESPGIQYSNTGRNVVVAPCISLLYHWYTSIHVCRKGSFPLGWSVNDDQHRFAGALSPRPAHHDS